MAASTAANAAGSCGDAVPSVPSSLFTPLGESLASAEPAEAGVALADSDEAAAELGNGHTAAAEANSLARPVARQRIAEVMNNVIHGGGVRGCLTHAVPHAVLCCALRRVQHHTPLFLSHRRTPIAAEPLRRRHR